MGSHNALKGGSVNVYNMPYRVISIIPVLDVMNGFVVHAVRGERSNYRPFTDSVLCKDAKPACVMDRLYDLGFRTIYIADLDSIMGIGNNRWVIDYALHKGFNVYADVGRDGLSLMDSDNLHYVIGTEYLVYPQELGLINNRVSSLDLEYERVKFMNGIYELSEVVESIVKTNIMPKALLIINLKYVGTMQGINKKALDIVRVSYNGPLFAGGGLRSIDEIQELARYNLDGLLIATALHKGLIKVPSIAIS
jgi:phosphoribosylformimino-5-aminoimidazole carboxamide ribotide isomerase